MIFVPDPPLFVSQVCQQFALDVKEQKVEDLEYWGGGGGGGVQCHKPNP